MAFHSLFQLSWLKRNKDDDPHLLTYELTTYSNDARYQVFHEQPNDWKLQIQFPQKSDEGIYECLVSSSPPLRRRFKLNVVGKKYYLFVLSFWQASKSCKNLNGFLDDGGINFKKCDGSSVFEAWQSSA